MKHERKSTPQHLFSSTARRFDAINNIITFRRIEKIRADALKMVPTVPGTIVDFCSGTGEMGRLARLMWPSSRIIGHDMNDAMMKVASEKRCYDVLRRTDLCAHEGEEDEIDLAVIAFALYDLSECAVSMLTRIRESMGSYGILLSIECERPENPLARTVLSMLRSISTSISFIRYARAVSHLLEEIVTSPGSNELISRVESCGYRHIETRSYMMGAIVANLYVLNPVQEG